MRLADASGPNPSAFQSMVFAAEDRLGQELEYDDVDVPDEEDGYGPASYYEVRPDEGSDVVVCVQESTSEDITRLSVTRDSCVDD